MRRKARIEIKAVFDTHRAYTAFKEAGFTDSQSQALIDQARDGTDALATKGDLDALARVNKADLDALAQATKADLQELELRLRHDLTLRLGAMVFAAAGLQVVVISILLALTGS